MQERLRAVEIVAVVAFAARKQRRVVWSVGLLVAAESLRGTK